MKILKLWGIPIHKILSDTEFVDKIRKGLRLSKKLVWIHVAVLLVLSVAVPKLIAFFWQMIEEMPDETEKMAWIGLKLGFIFGVFVAEYIIIAVQAILAALDIFDFNRGNRLLIKYHDMLQKIAVPEQDHEQQDE